MALKAADYAGFETRRREAAARGKLRGIGLATYIEACGIAPSAVVGSLGARAGLYESAAVRVHPTGSVTVFTGTHSHGQGHETTFAQLVADTLGMPIESIEIVHGDTAKIPFGMGTYGSRSLAVGGSAIVKALDKVIAKGRKIAAHLLEAAEADIEFKDGAFTVAGTDRSKTFGEVALTAYVPHNYPHRRARARPRRDRLLRPEELHLPVGRPYRRGRDRPRDRAASTIVNFTAADDFGRIINPMIVEGQVHGGLAQGIGQALLEGCVYDQETGQLVTGSYMDYAMPRADDLPNFALSTHVTMCTHNPLGVKGCGEAGRDRRAAGDRQRRCRRAGAARRPRISTCRPRRKRSGARSSSTAGRSPRNKGEPDVRIRLSQAREPRRRRELPRGQRRSQARRRRHDPDPDPEAAPRQAVRSGRSRRDRRRCAGITTAATRSSSAR